MFQGCHMHRYKQVERDFTQMKKKLHLPEQPQSLAKPPEPLTILVRGTQAAAKLTPPFFLLFPKAELSNKSLIWLA